LTAFVIADRAFLFVRPAAGAQSLPLKNDGLSDSQLPDACDRLIDPGVILVGTNHCLEDFGGRAPSVGIDAIPPLQGERGRPRCRPDCSLGDRAYDAEAIRQVLRTRHILLMLATRRTTHGSGLGQWRWVVERTFAWLNQFRRLRVRYEKRADMHEAFLPLGCALICWHALRKSWANG
jgi:transposase